MKTFIWISCIFLTEDTGQIEFTPPLNTWVKLSPLPDTPPSPRLGYEGACVWDSKHHVVIRYAGHNQGGGGEQHSEVWAFDPLTATWTFKEPNTSPPGLCCGQQNVFDPVQGRYIRFPSFSGSHGWQWHREIYLNDSSVWNYDLATNTWRNMRPLPTPHPRPLRCASWDSDNQVIVMFGGETSREGTLVYDPFTNRWTRMQTASQPEFRSGGNMAYDAARQRHILFGAQFSADPHTWAYNLRENKWCDMQPEIMPPTDQNDAVLTYDAINKLIIAVVKITKGEDDAATHRLETWTYDVAANKWTKMNPAREPDPSGNRARILMFAPEFNVAIMENRTHLSKGTQNDEQQILAYRFANAKPETPLSPPSQVQVSVRADRADVIWSASSSAQVVGYHVYRAQAELPWQAEFTLVHRTEKEAGHFADTSVEREKIYLYCVRAVDAEGNESEDSLKVRTQPCLVEDIVVSVISPQQVELFWRASDEEGVVGYRVERARVEVFTDDQLHRLKSRTPTVKETSVGAIKRIGQFERITDRLTQNKTFTDLTVDLKTSPAIPGEPIYDHRFYPENLDENGKPYQFAVYAYRIYAVNALGVESGDSPACFTIPSAPQFLFAKEDDTTCHLKWAANPEKNIKGYRVYRMDGRWDKDKITRLTPEPLNATVYRDQGAGESTRRYYVVAVDALGQEGFTSSPVWFNREWRRFYEPFTREWHQ